jgi:hypothetical protein
MNRLTDVDRSAPVLAHHQIDIDAPLGRVWSVSFAGEPVEADVASMQSMLDASLVAWLGHLKAAAESST